MIFLVQQGYYTLFAVLVFALIISLTFHEFGHALGLAHNDSQDSVMQASLGYGEVRVSVSKDDQSSMACEY